MKSFYLGLFTTLLLSNSINSCWSQKSYTYEGTKQDSVAVKKSVTDLYFHPSKKLLKQVDSVYNALTPKQRAAQMIMTASSTAPKLGYPYATALQLLKSNDVGNIIFLKGDMTSFEQQVKEMNTLNLGIKPIYGCDCEPSLMNGKWAGSTKVAKANQQKTKADILQNTAILNKDMKRVGVQWNFAPVADNAVNKEVISNRAFGNDAASIVSLSNAFIEATQADTIAATLKHFPGHGAVKGDSHKQSVYIDGEMKELETFRKIIQSSQPPMTVLVGHIVVKNNPTYNTQGLPATISRNIVTDLLRNSMKYDGLIVTDAMNMVAAAKVSNADWKAVEAGNDMIVMPKNPKQLNKLIVDALAKQDALSKQLETSIKRVIRMKIVLGII